MTPHDRWLEPDDEPEPVIGACTSCKGKGSFWHPMPFFIQCPRCKGTGEVELTDAERRQKAFDDFDPPDNDYGEPL